ncbi:MAG: SDR family NAD(P)-dependent oxidoreductase [Actinobacteria bacterium]|nr:SDR family NAD(P)-dependent oxidoreductase [Actinomycetota bacterium]
MFDPSGRRVLITGAPSGLGAALAMGLAEQGAVIGLAARRPDRLDAVLAEVRRHSPDSRAWGRLDLADLDGIDAFAHTASTTSAGWTCW